MSNTDPKQDNLSKEKKENKKEETFPKLIIPLFLFQKLKKKGDKDGVTLKPMLVYCWLYSKNEYSLKNNGTIYGKFTYTALSKEISNDLKIDGYKNIERYINLLIKEGWLMKFPAGTFKDKRQKGCLCMLSAKQAAMAKSRQQELQLQDEETTTVVESRVKPTDSEANENINNNTDGDIRLGPGEFIAIGGIRYYDREDNEHIVPRFAPPRPGLGYKWYGGHNKWYRPGEEPGIKITNNPSIGDF